MPRPEDPIRKAGSGIDFERHRRKRRGPSTVSCGTSVGRRIAHAGVGSDIGAAVAEGSVGFAGRPTGVSFLRETRLLGTTVHYRSLSSSPRGEESPGDCVQVPPVFARTPGPVRNERPTLGPGFGDGSSLGEREAHWRGSPICGRCPRRGHEAKGAQRGYLPSLPACSWPLFGLPWGHGTLIYIRYHY